MPIPRNRLQWVCLTLKIRHDALKRFNSIRLTFPVALHVVYRSVETLQRSRLCGDGLSTSGQFHVRCGRRFATEPTKK